MRRRTALGIWLLLTLAACIATYFHYAHTHYQHFAVLATFVFAVFGLIITMAALTPK